MTLPLTIPPGGKAELTVRFSPAAAGARSGVLSITSNAASSPNAVQLAGAASAVPVDPTNMPWLRTNGRYIETVDGEPMQLRSVHWYGFDIILMALPLWDRSYKTVTYNGGVQFGMLEQMKELGFNSIRLSVCEDITWPGRRIIENNGIHPANVDFFADGADPNVYPQVLRPSIECMDLVIEHARKLGLRIILDMHCLAPNSDNAQGTQGKWYTTATPGAAGGTQGTVGEPRNEEQWIAAWEFLANRYKNKPHVCGFDLLNEPYACTWDDSPTTGWPAAAERCAARIQAINPNALIIVEGVAGNLVFQPGDHIWGTVWAGNLFGVHKRPVKLGVPRKLVYSPHDYGAHGAAGVGGSGPNWLYDAAFPGNMPAIWDTCYGFIARDEIAPLWEGEFGGPFGPSEPVNNQWITAKRAFFADRSMSFSYFSINEGGGGLLGADRITLEQPTYDALQPLLAAPQYQVQPPQAPAKLTAVAGQILAGSAPFTIKAATWRGFNSATRFLHAPWQRSWRANADQIKAMGFNTVRIPLSQDTFGSGAVLTTQRVNQDQVNGLQNFDLLTGFDSPGILAIQALDNVLGYLNARKMRAILTIYDDGSGSPLTAASQANWIALQVALAQRYGDHGAVLGIEPYNAPSALTWAAWRPMVQAAGNAVLTAAPDWLIFAAGVAAEGGPDPYWPASNLTHVAADPVVLSNPAKLVYGVTEFAHTTALQPWLQRDGFPVASWPANLDAVWGPRWGGLVDGGDAAVMVMELGARFGFANEDGATGQPYGAQEIQWLNRLTGYLLDRGMSWAYTSYGTGPTEGGLVYGDWTTPQTGKLAVLQPLLEG